MQTAEPSITLDSAIGDFGYAAPREGLQNRDGFYAFKVNRRYTPTGKGLGLLSSTSAPLRQRSKRPCSRLISPVYQ